MARISGKLTAKGLGWDRNAIGASVAKVPADGGRVLIGRIAGIVNGIHTTVNDDNGEVSTGLKGTFRGISSKFEQVDSGTKDANGAAIMQDGPQRITLTAGRCYLPGGLQEMVEAAYAQATATPETKNATVSFALDLFAIPATNKAGYSYSGETLVEAAEADPLALLLGQAEQAALPTPTEPEPETPAKGGAKTK